MAELSALEGRKARIEAARQAFSQGRGGIRPPNPAEIDRIKTILDQIRKLTATAAKAKSGVKLATDALTLFNKIQKT